LAANILGGFEVKTWYLAAQESDQWRHFWIVLTYEVAKRNPSFENFGDGTVSDLANDDIGGMNQVWVVDRTLSWQEGDIGVSFSARADTGNDKIDPSKIRAKALMKRKILRSPAHGDEDQFPTAPQSELAAGSGTVLALSTGDRTGRYRS
jgi:hypothetical protein